MHLVSWTFRTYKGGKKKNLINQWREIASGGRSIFPDNGLTLSMQIVCNHKSSFLAAADDGGDVKVFNHLKTQFLVCVCV